LPSARAACRRSAAETATSKNDTPHHAHSYTDKEATHALTQHMLQRVTGAGRPFAHSGTEGQSTHESAPKQWDTLARLSPRGKGRESRRGRGHVPTLRNDRRTCTVIAHVGAPPTSEGFTEPLPRVRRVGQKGKTGSAPLLGDRPSANRHFSWACLQRPRNGASINAHHGANSKRWKRPRWGKRKRPRWGSVKAGALAEHRERPRWGHVETSALVAQKTCVHSKQIKHEHAREHTTRPHRNPTAQATPPSHPHPSPPTPAPTAHAHTRPRGA